jgi:hypothetical protein
MIGPASNEVWGPDPEDRPKAYLPPQAGDISKDLEDPMFGLHSVTYRDRSRRELVNPVISYVKGVGVMRAVSSWLKM